MSNSRSDKLFDADWLMSKGLFGWCGLLVICAFASWHILTNVWLIEPGRWQNCIHFGGFALIAAYITAPATSGIQGDEKTSGINWILVANILFGIATVSYTHLTLPTILLV